MPRRRYTEELYEEAVFACISGINLRGLYTKEQLLTRAGLPNNRKHWSELRSAMGRTCVIHGLGFRYDRRAYGWRVESVRTANNNLLWQELQRSWLPAMRRDIVGEVSQSETAVQVVASLIDRGHNPVALATMLASTHNRDGISNALHQDVLTELLAATAELLPEMDRQSRERIAESTTEVERVVGLLRDNLD